MTIQNDTNFMSAANQLLMTPEQLGQAVENGFNINAVASGNIAEAFMPYTVETKHYSLDDLATLADELSATQNGINVNRVSKLMHGQPGMPAVISLSKKGSAHTDGIMYEMIELAANTENNTLLFKGGLHRLTMLISAVLSVAEHDDLDSDELLQNSVIPCLVYVYPTEAQARASVLTSNGSRGTTKFERERVTAYSKHGMDVSDTEAVIEQVELWASTRDDKGTSNQGMSIVDAIPFLIGDVNTGNGTVMTDLSKANVAKGVVKALLAHKSAPCIYTIDQDDNLVLTRDKSAQLVKPFALAYLGGTVTRTMPASDIDIFTDAYLFSVDSNDQVLIPDTVDEDGYTVQDASYQESTATLTFTVASDIGSLAKVVEQGMRDVLADTQGEIARSVKDVVASVVDYLVSNMTPRAKHVVFPVSNYNPKKDNKRVKKS